MMRYGNLINMLCSILSGSSERATQKAGGIPRAPGPPVLSPDKVIDTSKLNNLHAFCDNDSTGHFCIAPHDMSKMQEWIDPVKKRPVY
jgi:hypothetical protein